MKAVQAQPDGSVSVVDMPVPVIGPGEALLRPLAAGICGSDLLDWYVRRKTGSVLGHELAGEIVEVGAGVERFAVGDRVVPHHHAPCLDCDACASGRYVHCERWRGSRLDPGGMAEYVRVPKENLERDTQRIPGGLSNEQASWTEPLATVVKSFRRARFRGGRSVLVIGLGPAGQLAVRLASALGASRIAATDRVASRIEAARASGATDLFDAEREPLAEAARRLTSGRGFDLVFVCPGKPGVVRAAADAVDAGGTLLLFTMSAPGEDLSLPAYDLYFREVSVVPSYSCGPREMRIALDLLAGGRVSVADLVSHRFPLARAAEAFERAREPEGSMKVMLTFEDEAEGPR